MIVDPTIESLREKIRALKEERDMLSDTPANAETARAMITDRLKAVRDQFDRERTTIQRVAVSGDAMYVQNRIRDLFRSQCLPGLLMDAVGFEPFAAALTAGLEDVVTTELTPEQVRVRLIEIGRDLDRLELQEEALIDKSERDGQPIERRPDARPEIVLALQEPL